MKQIILDTSAIVNLPENISVSAQGIQLVIPEAVLDELRAFDLSPASGSAYIPLVEQAINSATIEIVPRPITMYSEVFGRGPKLTPADHQLITLVVNRSKDNPTDEIVVATDDRDLQEAVQSMGLSTVSSKQLRDLYLTTGVSDGDVTKIAKKITGYQFKYLVMSALFGVGLTALGYLIVTNLNSIINTINVWGTVLVVIFLGLALYWFRARYRITYGATEIGVGVTAVISVFWPSFNFGNLTGPSTIQLLGGLYILVRGLDNIGKGIKGTRYATRWRSWFPS